MKPNSIKFSNLLRYGCLAAPVAFAGFPLYVLAPDYYATHYGVTLPSLGLALLALRLFDALQDPLIGVLSDQYRPYTLFLMLPAAIVLVFSVYGLFNLSFFSPLVWFVLCMGSAVTSYSILSINLNALGALWTERRDEQTRIAASREAFGLLGLILAVSFPSLLLAIVPEEQTYQWFSLFLLLLMALAFMMFFFWHKTTAKPAPRTDRNKNFFLRFQSFSNSSRKLLLVYVLSMMASSMPAVLVIFFVRDLLGAKAYIGLFLMLYFLSGVLFIPFWQRISQGYGKPHAWFLSMLLASVSFMWAFFLGEGDIGLYAITCIASGAALGADVVFPPAILADQLYASKAEHHASTHYAYLTLTAKISLALASGITLPALQYFDFAPDKENSSSALMGLSLAYALVPCLLKCSAALLLWRLFIHSKEESLHEKILSCNHHHRSYHHDK